MNWKALRSLECTVAFPGADSVEDLWQNLAAGRDTISFFTDDELAEAGLDVESLKASGHYVPARGVIRDAECFDRGFFGIHPKEAEVMDPQHRVFLEGCWEALERSGYAPDRIRRTGWHLLRCDVQHVLHACV